MALALLSLAATAKANQKLERDAYSESPGEIPHKLISENFAIKWGAQANVQIDDLRNLSDAFERAWRFEVDERGYPQPFGSSRYLFNVYIGGTGFGPPNLGSFKAWAGNDPEGYPMVVYSRLAITETDKLLPGAAHEFFHTIQFKMNRGLLFPLSWSWYNEASAVWMATEIAPASLDRDALVHYAFLPFLPVDDYSPPPLGPQRPFDWNRYYGAFIFLRYLTEWATGPGIVRDSYLLDRFWETPLSVLSRLLRRKGFDLGREFGRFAAHNAVWDYANGPAYAQAMEEFARRFPSYDYRFVEDLTSRGTNGRRLAPWATQPHRYGYNVVRLLEPENGSLRVDFRAYSKGTRGSAASYAVTLVRAWSDAPEYVDVRLHRSGDWMTGSLRVDAVGEEEALYLVIVAWSAWEVLREGFGYEYEMAIEP